MASSLAWAPYCTVCEESTRAVAVERAQPGRELPVYHLPVVAEPLARLVADASGEPETRSGGCAVVMDVPVKPSLANTPAGEPVIESDEASSVLMDIT